MGEVVVLDGDFVGPLEGEDEDIIGGFDRRGF